MYFHKWTFCFCYFHKQRFCFCVVSHVDICFWTFFPCNFIRGHFIFVYFHKKIFFSVYFDIWTFLFLDIFTCGHFLCIFTCGNFERSVAYSLAISNCKRIFNVYKVFTDHLSFSLMSEKARNSIHYPRNKREYTNLLFCYNLHSPPWNKTRSAQAPGRLS